ncbi:MAG: hypothetical protein ACYC8T_07055 [Myxococcaceae bacterium]
MSNRRWVGPAGLALLLALPAFAQKVVVLDFEGDRREKLRSQVEGALKKAEVVDVLPLARYKEAAARRKLKGASAMTPAAVGKLARGLGLDAAVEGALGDTFFVRILDSSGQELWSKDLPLKGGLISADHAKKLAKAVAAAAKSAGAGKAEAAEAAEAAEERGGGSAEVAVEVDAPTIRSSPRKDENAMPEIDLTASGPGPGSGEGGGEGGQTASGGYDATDPERDSDLDAEGRRPKVFVGPKWVNVTLSGSTVWRAYCSRPGVASCREYDAKDATVRPKGDTVDFSPQVPYAGVALTLEGFPMAKLAFPANGAGLALSYARGWSLTNVRVQTPSGETPEKQVVSVDDAFGIFGLYRYFFSYGDKRSPLVGYAGVRAGYELRSFEVDPDANVPLPGSHRAYPSFGLDVSVPLATLVKIEASVSYFLNPKAGSDEIAGYGNPSAFEGGATGRGLSIEAGLAGNIWGPLGYSVRFKLVSYGDQFYGLGQKWPCDDAQCGGAAEETYSGLTWGVSAAF